jgi:hypothetical protein
MRQTWPPCGEGALAGTEILLSFRPARDRPQARQNFGKTPGGLRSRQCFSKTHEGDLWRGKVLISCPRRTYLDGVLRILSAF